MNLRRKIMEKNYNCDALKRLARQAKNRLSNHKYLNGKGEYNVKNGEYLAEYKLMLLSSKEDEKLYSKVCQILSENRDVINPLGKLVDKNKFSTLSDKDKERYIFNLADKYKQMKQRFEKENEFSEVV